MTDKEIRKQQEKNKKQLKYIEEASHTNRFLLKLVSGKKKVKGKA